MVLLQAPIGGSYSDQYSNKFKFQFSLYQLPGASEINYAKHIPSYILYRLPLGTFSKLAIVHALSLHDLLRGNTPKDNWLSNCSDRQWQSGDGHVLRTWFSVCAPGRAQLLGESPLLVLQEEELAERQGCHGRPGIWRKPKAKCWPDEQEAYARRHGGVRLQI